MKPFWKSAEIGRVTCCAGSYYIIVKAVRVSSLGRDKVRSMSIVIDAHMKSHETNMMAGQSLTHRTPSPSHTLLPPPPHRPVAPY